MWCYLHSGLPATAQAKAAALEAELRAAAAELAAGVPVADGSWQEVSSFMQRTRGEIHEGRFTEGSGMTKARARIIQQRAAQWTDKHKSNATTIAIFVGTLKTAAAKITE